MMTSSIGNIFRATGHLCGEFTGHLIFARMNDWVNKGEAGDMRLHRANYDVIVMNIKFWDASGRIYWNMFTRQTLLYVGQ